MGPLCMALIIEGHEDPACVNFVDADPSLDVSAYTPRHRFFGTALAPGLIFSYIYSSSGLGLIHNPLFLTIFPQVPQG